MAIEQAENKITKEEYNEKILGNMAILIFTTIPLLLGEFIYFIFAIKIDPLKYPTLILLVYFILATILIKAKNPDLTTEEARVKYRMKLYQRRTLRGVLTNAIYCVYFGYMFYVLVF